jgi:hypothetical protein
VVPSRTYGTALTASQNVIEWAIRPSVCLRVICGDGEAHMPWVQTHSRRRSHSTRTHVSTRTHRTQTDRATPPRQSHRHVGSATDHHEQSCFFGPEYDGIGEDLDGFVAAVTIVAQSQCERATDYTDIETLVCACRLPIVRSPSTIRPRRTRARIR